MEHIYTTQRVYSTKVANRLLEEGYELQRVERNPQKEGYVRYIFFYKKGIKEAMVEASK